MNDSEPKKCPKCDDMMRQGEYVRGYGAVRLIETGDFRGDKIIPFHCDGYGYIELYNEKKLKP